MKLTALLPMKGYSERVPNKNMRLFSGKPLFHWVAGVLEASHYIDSVWIDTDSEVIAKDAALHFSKVKIIERPKSLRGDLVPMNDIIAHDIALCESEHFLQTHSTNPMLTLETLERAIEDYFSSLGPSDSVFSVTRVQSRFYDSFGRPVNHDPDVLLRTQDLPPLYEENSNFYIFSKASFRAAGNRRIGIRPKMFTMEKLEALDIDEEVDFILAEALYRLREKLQSATLEREV